MDNKLTIIIIFLAISFGGGAGLVFLFSSGDGSIRSKSPLTPTIELVIENNQVDTIYVYKHPKQ